MNDEQLRKATARAVAKVGADAVREEMKFIEENNNCRGLCSSCPGYSKYQDRRVMCVKNGFAPSMKKRRALSKNAKRVLEILDVTNKVKCPNCDHIFEPGPVPCCPLPPPPHSPFLTANDALKNFQKAFTKAFGKQPKQPQQLQITRTRHASKPIPCRLCGEEIPVGVEYVRRVKGLDDFPMHHHCFDKCTATTPAELRALEVKPKRRRLKIAIVGGILIFLAALALAMA